MPIDRNRILLLEGNLLKALQRRAEKIPEDLEANRGKRMSIPHFLMFLAKEAPFGKREGCDRCFLMADHAFIDVEADPEIQKQVGEIKKPCAQRIETAFDGFQAG